jgi:hypothetical protein
MSGSQSLQTDQDSPEPHLVIGLRSDLQLGP